MEWIWRSKKILKMTKLWVVSRLSSFTRGRNHVVVSGYPIRDTSHGNLLPPEDISDHVGYSPLPNWFICFSRLVEGILLLLQLGVIKYEYVGCVTSFNKIINIIIQVFYLTLKASKQLYTRRISLIADQTFMTANCSGKLTTVLKRINFTTPLWPQIQ